MEKIQILSIGRDPVLLQKLSQFINENPKWESTATVNDETAIKLFHQSKYDIILLIDELGDESTRKFKSLFSFSDPDLVFIKHSGDSTRILEVEINAALAKRKIPVKITDDVFKDTKSQ